MSAGQEHEVPSSREVEALLEPQRRLLARLRSAGSVSKGDLDAAMAQVTELASTVLGVDRTSVWRLTDQGAGLACVDMYVRSSGSHHVPGPLARASCPRYFEGLQTERVIAAEDARTDPMTSEMAVGYLAPNGIGAMLDAPIFLRGAMVGVLCHEHVGRPRRWNLWEQLVAGTLADFVAHILEVEERAKELRESEENFRQLFEASPTPLVLARVADGAIGLINSRGREISGIPAGSSPYELEAGQFYENPEDRERIVADVNAHGFVDNREVALRTFDGRTVQCLLSARALVYRGQPHIAVGFIDVTAMKEIEQRLRDAAMRDPLTGIYNRRHFYEVSAQEVGRARRYERPLSLAMLDVDEFKQKNDRFGHGVGDELLVALAKTASGELRKSDVLARYGGEEFVVLFPETALDEAERVTERIRETIQRSLIATTAGTVSITLSGGVSQWSTGDTTIDSLIERADRALYRAKGLGRNRIERAPATAPEGVALPGEE